MRGDTHAEKGAAEKAIADYEKAISIYPAGSLLGKDTLLRRDNLKAKLAAAKPVVMAATPAKPAPAPAVAAAPAIPLGRRVALVIGNSAYTVGPLANPKNDAAAIAKALSDDLHFETVLLRTDLTLDGLRKALGEMARLSAGADVAVVFYAGHGKEHDGVNYLIPVDATLETVTDIGLQAVPLPTVMAQIAKASRLKLVILDTCRTPLFRLAGDKRDQDRGLAAVEPDDNTLVAYAAKHGSTAKDGKGDHSPFTAALLKHLATPNLDVSFVFRKVRDDVMAATDRSQQPHLYGTLGADPIFLAGK